MSHRNCTSDDLRHNNEPIDYTPEGGGRAPTRISAKQEVYFSCFIWLDLILKLFLAHHIPGYRLSGGEKRRVELALVLAMDPKFIYLMNLLLVLIQFKHWIISSIQFLFSTI